MATEESVDKKISRKTGREWRKDLKGRHHKNLPSPHSEGYSKDATKRFYDKISSGKFRGLTDRSQLSSYFQKPKTTKGPEIKKRKKLQHGGRTNLLEELGRVEGESSNRNRRAEVSRIHGELNKGYSLGGRVGAAKRGFNKKILRKD